MTAALAHCRSIRRRPGEEHTGPHLRPDCLLACLSYRGKLGPLSGSLVLHCRRPALSLALSRSSGARVGGVWHTRAEAASNTRLLDICRANAAQLMALLLVLRLRHLGDS